MTRSRKYNMIGNEYFRMTTIVAIFTLLISVLALMASTMGIFNQDIYNELLLTGAITKFLVFGSIVQDIISIPASVLLIILSIAFIRKHDRKMLIIILGLTAYFFYGYGLYTIQGQYTSIYFIYLAILGLSIYSIIFGIIGLVSNINHVYLPKSICYSIGIFIAIILLVLIPAWIGRMTPDIISRVPGDVYGVFILDLSVVFPALAIIALKVIKGNNKGYLLAGVALVKVFTLCLSVALGEWLKPVYGFPQDLAMILIFSFLTIISAILGVLYFAKINFKYE